MCIRDSACSSTALPLLAATVIAILTFLPIYYSPHITGELLSSLVVVIGVSLMFSWVFALTQTPFFIQEFVRRPRPEELKTALVDGKYYNMFRRTLHKGWLLYTSTPIVNMVARNNKIGIYTAHLKMLTQDTSKLQSFEENICNELSTHVPSLIVFIGSASFILCDDLNRVWPCLLYTSFSCQILEEEKNTSNE